VDERNAYAASATFADIECAINNVNMVSATEAKLPI
jgi:hypothetical protein